MTTNRPIAETDGQRILIVLEGIEAGIKTLKADDRPPDRMLYGKDLEQVEAFLRAADFAHRDSDDAGAVRELNSAVRIIRSATREDLSSLLLRDLTARLCPDLIPPASSAAVPAMAAPGMAVTTRGSSELVRAAATVLIGSVLVGGVISMLVYGAMLQPSQNGNSGYVLVYTVMWVAFIVGLRRRR